jgi:hypothetical protein
MGKGVWGIGMEDGERKWELKDLLTISGAIYPRGLSKIPYVPYLVSATATYTSPYNHEERFHSKALQFAPKYCVYILSL